MDGTELTILQAASNILKAQRPDRSDVQLLNDYAEQYLPEHAFVPLDELATLIAIKLMHIEDKPAPSNA